MTEPRMPVRTRIMRPALWIDAATATLSDGSFRLYLGLTTCSDDDGWLLWRPETLAAHLCRFQPLRQRERWLESGRRELAEKGLLVVHECGCGFLANLFRDFRTSGGNHSEAVHTYHQSHACTDPSVQVGTSPAPSSSSSSFSATPSSSSSFSLPGTDPGRGQVVPSSGPCRDCGKPMTDKEPGAKVGPGWIRHGTHR